MSHDLIDLQFNRAVDIVQNLPKTGPIQTDYEEKLTMYSLFKQATAGNVKSPRPSLFDMLGRAKWDAWAKHKDLDPYQAKWLYVDALLKVLRKYSDKTIARSLVEELENYSGDPSNLVMSHTSKSGDSESSGSTDSDDEHITPNYDHSRPSPHRGMSMEEEDQDQASELPAMHLEAEASHGLRPNSSMSSRRYRTPMADSLAMSPPLHGIPSVQPMPVFQTPSAFADPSPMSMPSSLYPQSSYVGQFSQSSQGELTSPPPGDMYPVYRSGALPLQRPYGPPRPVSRPTLERAVENVQGQIAALSERIESLESISLHPSRSHIALSPRGLTPVWATGRGSPPHRETPKWDLEDLGMWSLVIDPVARGIDYLRKLAKFFAKDENRSPSMIIFRRLSLDISFLLCFLAVIRLLWKKSGVRRREVYAALVVLLRAILGSKPKPRLMVDRGV
ncbi:acyl CoA binding protein-domain-containing protein [Mycena floridula]|nr:acyl CoA binding protein-domain-containing protein [Mycena floridula]